MHDKPLRRVSPAISSSGGDFDPCLSDDDITRINVFARKNTPPSDRPLKYTCPYCHKKYAEDREDYSLYHIHVNCPRKNGASALTAAPESGEYL